MVDRMQKHRMTHRIEKLLGAFAILFSVSPATHASEIFLPATSTYYAIGITSSGDYTGEVKRVTSPSNSGIDSSYIGVCRQLNGGISGSVTLRSWDYYSRLCANSNEQNFGLVSFIAPNCPAHSRQAGGDGRKYFCECIAPYALTPTQSCELDDLTITLSGGSEVEPSNGSTINTLPFIATVKNQSTGQPPTNPVKVHISLKVDPTSGGHDHGDSSRPRGGIANVQTCPSDDKCWSWTSPANNGVVVFNFNPTETSGKYTIMATCDGCTNNPQTAEVKVKVAGLEIIPDSSFYTFVGDTNEHSKNHYLTPEASTVLQNIAISYHIEDKFWQLKQVRRGKKTQYTYTPSMLNVNDASLEWGGKFDIHGKWKGDHKGHRRGIVADVRANQININNGAIPLQSFTNFQKLAASYDAVAQIHCSDKTRIPPTCIVNGTEDDGRHFHVLLLGDDQ